MKWWQTLDEHQIIRETCGYDVIDEVDLIDLPQVIDFLRICHNYTKMQNIQNTR